MPAGARALGGIAEGYMEVASLCLPGVGALGGIAEGYTEVASLCLPGQGF